MQLVIMAAGMSSRYGSLKQIEPVGPNGEFIMDYSIYDAIRAGFDRVILVIREENYEIFKNSIGLRLNNKIKIDYVFQDPNLVPNWANIPKERTKPLGTAHTILCTKEKITDNFLIINADDFYGHEPFKIMGDFLSKTTDNNYGMVGYILKNTVPENGTVSRGVCQIENDNVESIRELKNISNNNGSYENTTDDNKEILDENAIVSMNFFGLTPNILPLLEEKFEIFLKQNDLIKDEFLLPEAIKLLMREGKCTLKNFSTNSKWLGMTYKEDRIKVEKGIKDLIKQGIYPEDLWN